MQILKIQNNYLFNQRKVNQPNFKSAKSLEVVATHNFGKIANGFIGKVETIKANGEKALLNLIKSSYSNYEIYNFTDDYGRIIGKIEFTYNKYQWRQEGEKDHVFVSELKNFSNPETPYYTKGLEEYKQIGTKLLQLALERSYQAGFDGNIQLVAKNRKNVIDFYKNLGFQQPASISRYDNPYRFSLSEEGKEFLSKKYGGLQLL